MHTNQVVKRVIVNGNFNLLILTVGVHVCSRHLRLVILSVERQVLSKKCVEIQRVEEKTDNFISTAQVLQTIVTKT